MAAVDTCFDQLQADMRCRPYMCTARLLLYFSVILVLMQAAQVLTRDIVSNVSDTGQLISWELTNLSGCRLQIISGGRNMIAGLAVRNRGWCCGSCLGWISGTDPNDPAALAGPPQSMAAGMYIDPNAAPQTASQHAAGPYWPPRVQWDPALQQPAAQQALLSRDPYSVPAVVPVNSLQHSNSLLRRKSGIPAADV